MTTDQESEFYQGLQRFIEGLLSEFDLISAERKEQLEKLGDYIQRKQLNKMPVALNFICTHNSRRSHLSQIWAATAAAYYQLENLNTFSGGTEATAFHPNAVTAMERAGFQIENPGGKNPHYQVSFAKDLPPLVCFSKTYDDPYNPQKEFGAVMTCSHADENCPFIPGVEMRLSLTYDDPKEADGTPQESARYDERVRQIGREIFYCMNYVATKA